MPSKKGYVPKKIVIAGRVEIITYLDIQASSVAGMDAFTQDMMEQIEKKARSVSRQRKHKTAVRAVKFHVPHATRPT